MYGLYRFLWHIGCFFQDLVTENTKMPKKKLDAGFAIVVLLRLIFPPFTTYLQNFKCPSFSKYSSFENVTLFVTSFNSFGIPIRLCIVVPRDVTFWSNNHNKSSILLHNRSMLRSLPFKEWCCCHVVHQLLYTVHSTCIVTLIGY